MSRLECLFSITPPPPPPLWKYKNWVILWIFIFRLFSKVNCDIILRMTRSVASQQRLRAPSPRWAPFHAPHASSSFASSLSARERPFLPLPAHRPRPTLVFIRRDSSVASFLVLGGGGKTPKCTDKNNICNYIARASEASERLKHIFPAFQDSKGLQIHLHIQCHIQSMRFP